MGAMCRCAPVGAVPACASAHLKARSSQFEPTLLLVSFKIVAEVFAPGRAWISHTHHNIAHLGIESKVRREATGRPLDTAAIPTAKSIC